MSDADLKNDVDIFNNAFPKSHLFDHLKEVAKKGNFSLGILMFIAPPLERLTDKKQIKDLKDLRRDLQKFFKEDRKKIMLTNTLSILSIPEQLAKIMDRSCRPAGFNRNLAAGGELYSMVQVYNDGQTARLHGITETLRLLSISGEPNPAVRCAGIVVFNDHKIKQVVPVTVPDTAAAADKAQRSAFPSTADLKELEILCKNYETLDGKVKEELETGLNYLERIREETDSHIKLSLLAAAIDYFIQAPEKDPQLYFNGTCKEISAKTGFIPADKNLFDHFFNLRKMLSRERKKAGLDGVDTKNGMLTQLEQFYRLLLKKIINDPTFLKQTLPGIKAAQRKELKKAAIKKKWRKFPGRYLARLFEEP